VRFLTVFSINFRESSGGETQWAKKEKVRNNERELIDLEMPNQIAFCGEVF